jgi:5'-deoxynucleotidase YfbR-like HD superfamily hydrolase
VDDIVLEDIAHALSLQCRFSGHTSTFYSVAQHSILVAAALPTEYALTGLMHDASEAYLNDLASPVKNAPGLGEKYRYVERRLMQVISSRFGLIWPIPIEVHQADLRMLETERRDLLAHNDGTPELWEPWTGGIEPYPDPIQPMPPLGAEITFTTMFNLLRGE